MQYTIRRVPKVIDTALRAKARSQRTSLNEAAIDALKRGLGVSDLPAKKRTVSDIVGTFTSEDAKAFDEAREIFDQIDEDAWR